MIEQTTLRSEIDCEGIGLHSGAAVTMRLKPADAETGITFVRADLSGAAAELPARFDAVTHTMLGTNVSNDAGASVATIEHLMSALFGLGVDNARIEVNGPEIPIMDGSSGDFVDLIDRAGLKKQAVPRRFLEISDVVEVGDETKSARLEPADQSKFSFEIDFPNPVIGQQSFELSLSPDTYRTQIGKARTFGFFKDAEALRAAGLALGAGLENTIVVDDHKILNPEPLRFPDEFVRHKILDAIGDLALAGGPLRGRYVGVKAGHALNNELLSALFARPEAFKWTHA